MPDFPFTVTDLAIVGVLLISAVLAFGAPAARGAVDGGLAWRRGGGHFRPSLCAADRPRVHLAAAARRRRRRWCVIFIVALLALSLLTRAVSRRVQDSALNAVDRSLGFLFGLLRGAALVCLAYIPVNWLLAPSEQPEWIRDARSRPLVEQGAAMIQSLFDPQRMSPPQALDPPRAGAKSA